MTDDRIAAIKEQVAGGFTPNIYEAEFLLAEIERLREQVVITKDLGGTKYDAKECGYNVVAEVGRQIAGKLDAKVETAGKSYVAPLMQSAFWVREWTGATDEQ